jgi:hypothetical protein
MTEHLTDEWLVASALAEPLPDSLAAHLAECAECLAASRRLAFAVDAMRFDAIGPSPTVLHRVKRLAEPIAAPRASRWDAVRRLVASVTFDSAAGAAAGLRGGADTRFLVFGHALADVEIQLERSSNSAESWRIVGQVAPAEAPLPLTIAVIDLRDGELLIETETDENGLFSLDAAEGSYELLVGLDRVAIVLGPLEVR